MKLSKSKLALAKLINENGGWVDDSVYAANDACGIICGYLSKPIRRKTTSYHWIGSQRETWICGIKTPQWHQCVLSREEYYQAYPKADADGWIEWKGGECPVEPSTKISVRYRNGGEFHRNITASSQRWSNNGWPADIIAYRTHKPEVKPEFSESAMRSIPEPELDDSESRLAKALELVKMAAPHLLSDKYKFNGDEVMGERKPTIEQLAQDYRNKIGYANRKQQEADDAKAEADAALGDLERAGEALGLLIGIAKPDPELAITDWRDLRVNDVIFVGEYDEHESGDYVVIELEDRDYVGGYAVKAAGIDGNGMWIDTAREWRFIRRP